MWVDFFCPNHTQVYPPSIDRITPNPEGTTVASTILFFNTLLKNIYFIIDNSVCHTVYYGWGDKHARKRTIK